MRAPKTPGAHRLRFWAWIHGAPVKLSLEDGADLEHYHTQPHEEGWASEYHRWTRHKHLVFEEIEHDGHDCDGRFTTSSAWVTDRRKIRAALARCRRHIEGDKRYKAPDWDRLSAGQRDYTAEAMGY